MRHNEKSNHICSWKKQHIMFNVFLTSKKQHIMFNVASMCNIINANCYFAYNNEMINLCSFLQQNTKCIW